MFLPLPAAWRRPPLIQLAAARNLVTLPSPTSNELFKLFKLFLDSDAGSGPDYIPAGGTLPSGHAARPGDIVKFKPGCHCPVLGLSSTRLRPVAHGQGQSLAAYRRLQVNFVTQAQTPSKSAYQWQGTRPGPPGPGPASPLSGRWRHSGPASRVKLGRWGPSLSRPGGRRRPAKLGQLRSHRQDQWIDDHHDQ